ncbi:GNAT family N-acetyltransferase [Thalassobacillus sp. C254]|uniref:GNAT family N-acetyltransferase n=1 Tax=Thalassobacillus sp. C254 TaxID=1225341 RepID=UPI0006D00F34|nr:GNAT family N-acetyltransferase [Thalassobacillus sp. C254]
MSDAYNVRFNVFVEEQKVPEEEEIDEFEEEAVHFVAYDQDKPIGAGRFREVEGVGKVERICVLADYRHTGAGRLLMEAIEAFAKEQRVNLKLNAQTRAKGFYEKLGYHVTSGEFMDAGIPHVEMKKPCSCSNCKVFADYLGNEV